MLQKRGYRHDDAPTFLPGRPLVLPCRCTAWNQRFRHSTSTFPGPSSFSWDTSSFCKMLTLGSYPGENRKLRLRGSLLIPAVRQLGKLSLNKMAITFKSDKNTCILELGSPGYTCPASDK